VRVLIIGNGGREHAIAWKCAQSPLVSEVLVAPGNAGTAREPNVRNVAVATDDFDGLVKLARGDSVDLTIVGPETPLVAGLVDRFEREQLRCFGPSRAGAQLEGSKAFTKEFLQRHRIPTAAYETFTDFAAARAYVRGRKPPIVIKADGLAAGKGVVIAPTIAEAEAALVRMLEERHFGAAGTKVVVEDFMRGEEASFIAVVDGTRIVPLASSQDHKTRDDADRGPNTGGMGAYSPAPVVTSAVHAHVMRDIMLPTVRGLAADGIRYRGFLYAGLMIDESGQAKVVEFNCRLGDPETQPILFRLKSDLVRICLSCFDGTLGAEQIDWDDRATVGVVMASRGYPDAYDKGKRITGLEHVSGTEAKMFHAGTRLANGEVVTDGGRVLCSVALGDTVAAARDRAYRAVAEVSWDGAFWRTDIGYRAVERERASG
jgi:phosphoribosylamine--glycine ligase